MTTKPDKTLQSMDVAPGLDLRMNVDPRMLSWDVFLFGEICSERMSEIIHHLILLDSTEIKSAVNLMICSPGGECAAGYALIDVLASMRHPVRTVALGEVCSMASLIFIAGTPGMRFIGSRSMVLFHPLSDTISDYGTFIKDRIVSLEYSEKFASNLMTERTSMPKDLIDKAEHGEVWLDAGQAIKYNVADSIITDSKVISKIYSRATAGQPRKKK